MSFRPVVSAFACKCDKCGRETLVEIPQFGVSHIMQVITTCWECLDAAARENADRFYKITAESFKKPEVS